MKPVIYKDENGYLKRTLVKESDSDEMAKYGVPAGPPDIDELDWRAIKREVNNVLVSSGLFNWQDVMTGEGFTPVAKVLVRHLKELYMRQAREEKKERNG
jgi:hypothetical protein